MISQILEREKAGEAVVIEIDREISENERAVDDYIRSALRLPEDSWDVPIAPEKWSPAQITEHVALVFEQTLRMVEGSYRGPSFPRVLRPLIRVLFLNRTLRTGAFPKGIKAPPMFQPGATSRRDEGLSRMQKAGAALRAAFLKNAATGNRSFQHPFFGTIEFTQNLALQTLHVRHHERQIRAD